MIRHALKLIWNRRRANRLVVVEIAAAFVVCFVLAALAVNLWTNYRRPLGFEYENIWNVSVRNAQAGMAGFGLGNGPSYSDIQDQVLRALRALPRTEGAEPIWLTPFVNLTLQTSYAGDGDREIMSLIGRMTGNGLRMLGVEPVEGRLFGPEDDGQDYRAVVVNREFVKQAFEPDQNPIGRRIDRFDPNFPIERLTEAQREVRIVGVIDDFRQHGEFGEPFAYTIRREEPRDETGSQFTLVLKVAPGTTADFEEAVATTIESVAPGWRASIQPWTQLRAQEHRSTLLPLTIAAVVAAFFIALVVMGLIGVLWQDVVRRTQEIGLRRALGARAANVRRQIQLEIVSVGAAGILIGGVIALQFPLLELIARIDWASAIPGIGLAAGFVLLLVMAGALYPSWLASRRDPADALRYE